MKCNDSMTPTRIKLIYTFDKSLLFSFIKTLSGFEPLPCASLLDCRPAPQPIEPLTSSKDWVSRGVLIPLFYGTGLSKFEDNSTELFNRVAVK